MDEVVGIIREILNREDIEGLLSLGAPPDEYESEARLLTQSVQALVADGSDLSTRQARLAGEIRETWRRMFGPFSESDLAQREAAFNRVAAQIVLALPQFL
ncbi:MAG: hypothetical protein ACRD2P_09775 [Terriglobia bacterium]